MELCPRCNTPFSGRDLCPKDGTLRHPGVVVGERYQLDRPIGSGGMGVVYAARHKMLGKGVAVKILRGDLSTDTAQVSRFLREAQLCSQLRHSNIVDITDFGRDVASGSLYLVMELLIGTSLAEVVAREGAFTAERALPILRQVCSALSAAHQAGVIHRDLTPRNVFLTEQSGRRDVVKLLDFGISRLVGDEDRVTGTGVPIGTTPYMPPEQLRGTAAQDHRVDIYSFGVMAYELLTGMQPWKERSPVLLIAEKLSGQLPDISKSELGQSMPGLAQLITECLASNPEQRPASAIELEQRLLASGGGDLSQTENLSGMRAGSYRLVRLLGSGGLGSVWLGEHPVIGSRVAIKVLHPQVSESMDVVRRFITEAQAVNRMESPHIVKIFDFGKLNDGRDYAAMEFLEGKTLGQQLAKHGAMRLTQARGIAMQIVSALDAAHSAGVVHRDLKPDNVFLTGTEDAPLVKVLDFGIAKLTSGEGTSVHQTRLGLLMGTPLYAAPEQVDGQTVGPAADIYSLGSVIFEMLSGEPPFVGPLHQLLAAKMMGPPPSLGDRVTGLESAIVELVREMLSRAPEQRPTLTRIRQVLETASSAEGQCKAERHAVPHAPTVQWTPRPQSRPPRPDRTGPPSGAHPLTGHRSILEHTTIIGTDRQSVPPSAPPELLPREIELGAEVQSDAPRTSRRALLASIAVLVIALAAVGIGSWLARNHTDKHSAVPSPDLGATVTVSTSAPKAASQSIDASSPATVDSHQPAPESAPALVLIESSPTGASVLLRGREVGKTPVKIRLDPRLPSVEVELQKAGYRSAQRMLRPGQPGPVVVQLKPSKNQWKAPFADPHQEKRTKASAQPVKDQTTKQTGKPKKTKPVLANPFQD